MNGEKIMMGELSLISYALLPTGARGTVAIIDVLWNHIHYLATVEKPKVDKNPHGIFFCSGQEKPINQSRFNVFLHP